MRFIYPATIKEEDGFFTVSFRDISHALTDGATFTEALDEASDCLGEALASCMIDNEPIPSPSRAQTGEVLVVPPALIAAKAALYVSARKEGLTKTALAKRLHVSEAVGRRLLNPRHPTKIVNLDKALHAMGKQMIISIA